MTAFFRPPAFRFIAPALRNRALLVTALACVTPGAAHGQCDPQWAAGFDQITITGFVEASAVHENGIVLGTNFPAGWGANVLRYTPGGTLQTIGGLSNNPFAANPEVRDLLSFDFGTGPEVVVGGAFDQISGLVTNNVARWNGTTWTALATGLGDGWDGSVNALCAFDDGTGLRLYAAGGFDLTGVGRAIARWNGSAWEHVGGVEFQNVHTLCVHDDGSGPALYAAASFTQVSGIPTPGVARWNGSSWSAVGTGTIAGYVWNLAVHDGGNGPQLYAGGAFTAIGGVTAANIARWDGTAWSAVGAGTNTSVQKMISHDDGGGAALYATGSFGLAGGAPAAYIARWHGSAWSTLGTGLNHDGSTAVSWNDGSGPALVVGGSFDTAGGVATPRVARWRAGSWERLTNGLGFDAQVKELVAYDDGSGTKIFAGGNFTRAGEEAANHVARFDGTTWNTLGGGLTASFACAVEALVAFDDGGGTQLYAGGSFTHAGGVAVGKIARWNGTSWSALPGGGVQLGGYINALCVHDDGSGPALYAGGQFTQIGGVTTRNIARWDGTAWSALGGGTGNTGSTSYVSALASWDDGHGQGLFIGGVFPDVSGIGGTRNLACWRGGTGWSPLGGPFFGGAGNVVDYLGVHDDGNGPQLWLGGLFTWLGGYYAKGVGTWDGTRFWPVGAGFPVGSNEAYAVKALCTYDAGAAHGPQVHAVGFMQDIGGTSEDSLARWNGTAWEPVAGGLIGAAYALAVHDDGTGPKLWVGGHLLQAGNMPSSKVARLDPACADPIPFCFGDGTGTACPCGNAGSSGNGCASSFAATGAHLAASGIPSVTADTIVLSASGLSPAPTTFFQGTQRQTGGAGSVFGDGLRCAGGSIIRLGAMPTTAGTSQYPGAGSEPVSVRGQVSTAGGTRTYQGWYRNAATFCTSATFNLTNGLEIRWAP